MNCVQLVFAHLPKIFGTIDGLLLIVPEYAQSYSEEARQFEVDIRGDVSNYEDEISKECLATLTKAAIKKGAVRGDVIHIFKLDYRNDGKTIFDGEKVINLDDTDEYGNVPKQFKVYDIKDGYRPAKYWNEVITHNNYVWCDVSKDKTEIMANITSGKCPAVSINDKDSDIKMSDTHYTWFTRQGKPIYIVGILDDVNGLDDKYVKKLFEKNNRLIFHKNVPKTTGNIKTT